MRAVLARLLDIANELDACGFTRQADRLDSAMSRLAYGPLGEWWLKDDGSAEFADSDEGDFNHDMIASQEIFNRMGFDIPNPYGYSDDVPYTKSEANTYFWDTFADPDGTAQMPPEMEAYREMMTKDGKFDDADLIHYLAWSQSRHLPQEDREIVMANIMKSYQHLWDGLDDPRVYARKNWGWHRVHGTNIETEALTPETMRSMANGLAEAYPEQYDRLTYNIEVWHPRHKFLQGVSYDEIDSGLVAERMKETFEEPPKVGPRVDPNSFYKYPGG